MAGSASSVRAAAALLALAMLSGCTTGMPSPTPSATGVESPSPSPTPSPTPTVPPTFPLTGLSGSATNPTIAAKIDNHPDARPQIGLEATDLVVEELVEGGLTRFLAVWQSHVPDLVGPVRSVRPMDPAIVTPLGGMIAYSGGQLPFVRLMQQQPVVNLSDDSGKAGSLFTRTRQKAAPHNLLLRASQAVAAHADLSAPPSTLFPHAASVEAATAATAGQPASTLSMAFSTSSKRAWTWDAASGAWLRSQDGKPANDPNGQPYRATNVTILRVDIVINKSGPGANVPETVLNGRSGEAWFAADGRIVHGSWSKGADFATPIRFVTDAGVTISFAPGNQWIELVPTPGTFAVQ